MTSAKTGVVFLLALFATTFCPRRVPGDDAATEPVGDHGDAAQLIFQGDCPFTSVQLRFAAESDLELQIAATPTAPLDRYLQTVSHRFRDGFMHAGYDQPEVDAHLDPATGKVVVAFKIGRRWKCGQIVVRGAKTVDVADLTRRLTTITPPAFFQNTIVGDQFTVTSEQALPGPMMTTDTAASWTKGDNASFDPAQSAMLTREVRTRLAAMGYFHPFLKVSVEPAEHDASMIINLLDEGPHAVLGRIEFETLDRNKPASVQELMNIKPGDPVDLDRINQMQQKLWDSGRFIHHSMSLKRIPGDDSRVILHVDIKEADKVPLLTEPLTDVDQAMLRVRKWLLTAGDDGRDVLITIGDPKKPDAHAEIAWGGLRGMAADCDFPGGNHGAATQILGTDGQIRWLVGQHHLEFYLPKGGCKVDVPLGSYILKWNSGIQFAPDLVTKKNWTFDFGLWVTGVDEGQGCLKVLRTIAPVAALGQVDDPENNCYLEGSRLILEHRNSRLRFDAASGALLDGGNMPGSGTAWSCQIKPGAMDAMVDSIRHAADKGTSDTGPFEGLFRSAVYLLCSSNILAPEATTRQRERMGDVVNRLLDQKSMQTLGGLVADVFAALGKDVFTLPIDADAHTVEGMGAIVAKFGFVGSGTAFAPRSWPWTLVRCASLRMIGQIPPLDPEMRRAYGSVDNGPLARLAIAEWLGSINPAASRSFAIAGLNTASPEAFAKDFEALFAGTPRMAGVMLQAAENLRSLSPEDVDAIASVLRPDAAAAFRAAVDELQNYRHALTQRNVDMALEEAWNAGGRSIITTELKRLAEAP